MKHEPAGLKREDTAALRSIALFQRLSDPALDALLASAVIRPVPRGTTLFVQDEPADRFFVLLDGWVKLYRLTRDGTEAIVTIVAPGESFAEAAMFAGIGYPVCAQAVDDCRLLTVSAAAFARCLQQDVEIAFAMLASLSLRMRSLVQQIEQLKVQSAPQRVGSFLLRFCAGKADGGKARFELPFDKSLIAKRLGIQPETFSRALAKLRALGVTTQGSQVTIDDIAALREFCQDEAATEEGCKP